MWGGEGLYKLFSLLNIYPWVATFSSFLHFYEFPSSKWYHMKFKKKTHLKKGGNVQKQKIYTYEMHEFPFGVHSLSVRNIN